MDRSCLDETWMGDMSIYTAGLSRGSHAVAACAPRFGPGPAAEPIAACSAAATERGAAAGHVAPLTLPAKWFRDHVNALWRLVARLGVPAHNIEDLVQEVFIIACRRRADIAEDQVRSFLLGTAIRLCANYKRRAHTRLEVSRDETIEPSASPDPNAEQLLIAKRWRELLEAALVQLSDPHRTIFVLFELEGLSSPEIAALLALPLGTVASRLQRARTKFFKAATALQASVTEDP